MNAPAKVLAFYDEADRHFELYVRPMMNRASLDLVDDLMLGKKVKDCELSDILDDACQTERYFDFLELVAKAITAHYSGLDVESDMTNLKLFAGKRVEEYVQNEPDWIEDRARLLADFEEDMSKQRTNDE